MSELEYPPPRSPRRNAYACSVYPIGNRPSGFPTRDLGVQNSNGNVPRTEVLPSPHDPSGMGRRLTAPSLNSEGVRVLMKVRPLSSFRAPKADGSHPI